MGLNPIEYKPWKGKRSEHGRRFLVIADNVVRFSLRSKWFLAVLIIGAFLTLALPLLVQSIAPHQSLTGATMANHLSGTLFFLFTVILTAMVCSDLLAEDQRSNSMVLYLSRALKPEGYVMGKFVGALLTLGIFALLPPLILSIAITATQSGPDYVSSAVVIGETVVAGLWATLFLVPLAMLISSLTRRRTYAAVGTFMVVAVLGIIAGIFSRFDPNWSLLNPNFVLTLSYNVIFGLEPLAGINGSLLAAVAASFVLIPLALVYYQVVRREVGK